ncbi:apiosidase-like domain-containing protein [Hydrogenophaga sp. MI9]|uniref:apiosidase-like domain-containing protein n=1 Tax=Hydrogenophaga sp. MI9 TaxID=3453719 RepID=UPI003EEB372C
MERPVSSTRAPTDLSTTPYKAHQHQAIELRFPSTTAYAEPFRELVLDVVFTAPSGKTVVAPAFWAGEDTWCVRYASPETGVHAFRSQCSDEGNPSLHGQAGEVEIEPYLGDNPLYRHGGIRVADDRRHFCHADGTPFFWLGDTWWMGLCGRLSWPQDFQALAHNRKEIGFNVIQLVAGLYPDMPLFDERGRSSSGFCWETDLSRINPRFFDEADQRIFHLVEQGLTPCILGAWGYYLPMIGLENMQRHWRYLIARWGALPVVWAAAGEQTMPWYLESDDQKAVSRTLLRSDWTRVIADMRSINGFGRPITTHPFESARESVTDANLLDFDMQQTGHGAPTAHHAMRAWQGWRAQPAMPVISGEARYEGLEIQPLVTARDAREAFWAHALHSGLAGHTYGANGIWQVNTVQQPFGASPTGSCWGNMPWEQAMQLPGARQLGLAKQFLRTLPWHEFEPLAVPEGRLEKFLRHRPRLRRLAHRLGWRPAPHAPVALGIAREKSVAIAYTASDQPFRVDLTPFRGPVKATWIDPVSFEEHLVQFCCRGRQMHIQPHRKNAAGDNDWLLLLQPAGSPSARERSGHV